jgi:hypothetical protein
VVNSTHSMQGHSIAEALEKQFATRTLNEADTRHQIINRLLHEVLSWPHESVFCEQKVHPGYTDFVLRDKATWLSCSSAVPTLGPTRFSPFSRG